MSMSARRVPRLSAVLVVTAAVVAACGGGSDTARHARYRNGANGANGASGAPGSESLVRGTVASVSPGDLVVQTGTGSVTVKLAQPYRVYHRQPGSLADVKDDVFVGVTTVKQSDGTEQAREIHIFPEALRGLGEGSRMMTQNAGGGGRMTNGAVSGSRMTNGAVAGSRMSNGSVAHANGSSLVVQYAGGSLKVVVPPNTPVTEIKESSKALAPGDQVVVPATRAPDGSLSTDKVLLSGK